nr:hypothetical protein [Escherichia coli]
MPVFYRIHSASLILPLYEREPFFYKVVSDFMWCTLNSPGCISHLFSLIWHCGFLNALCDAENREKPTTQNLRMRAHKSPQQLRFSLEADIFKTLDKNHQPLTLPFLHYPLV